MKNIVKNKTYISSAIIISISFFILFFNVKKIKFTEYLYYSLASYSENNIDSKFELYFCNRLYNNSVLYKSGKCAIINDFVKKFMYFINPARISVINKKIGLLFLRSAVNVKHIFLFYIFCLILLVFHLFFSILNIFSFLFFKIWHKIFYESTIYFGKSGNKSPPIKYLIM